LRLAFWLVATKQIQKKNQMINISIQQASMFVQLIEDEQNRIMLQLSETDVYKETNKLIEKRKKLQMMHDDINYKIDNIERKIV
jgi:hypothetical protein